MPVGQCPAIVCISFYGGVNRSYLRKFIEQILIFLQKGKERT
nr:MAG TPA: hypothetical protein [Caudoviricetes sp.]